MSADARMGYILQRRNWVRFSFFAEDGLENGLFHLPGVVQRNGIWKLFETLNAYAYTVTSVPLEE